jgi:hypothetical protein
VFPRHHRRHEFGAAHGAHIDAVLSRMVRALPGGDPLPLIKALTMLERRFIST